MERWTGKVAVVTGASSGIGAAIAKQLVEAGLKVVGFARRKEKIEEIAKSLENKMGNLYACKVDMTVENEIKAGFKWTLENVGPIHVLVNNAGVATNTSLYDGDTKLWKKILDTNVLGLCIATRETIKIMRDNHIDGHIIHMNSMAGHSVPNFPNGNVYSPSKYAVTSLTETLRKELISLGSKIKISSISPGVVKTEISVTANFDLSPEMIKSIPMLDAKDIADAVMYVLSTNPGVQVHDLLIQPIGQTI